MDWAPARIGSLRCGDLKSNLYCLRCSPVTVEEVARVAPRLGRRALIPQLATLLELLKAKRGSANCNQRPVRKVSPGRDDFVWSGEFFREFSMHCTSAKKYTPFQRRRDVVF